MARRPTPTLTEAEYRLMNILWDLGSATISDTAGEPSARMRSAILSASMSALSVQSPGSLPASGGAASSSVSSPSDGNGQKWRASGSIAWMRISARS